MFFQDATDPAAAAAASEQYTKFSTILENVKAKLSENTGAFKLLNNVAKGIAETFQEIGLEAEQLNKQFLGNRTRLLEITNAINLAAPGVVNLGGKFEDVRKTIVAIAEGSRTQTIATQEQVEEIFAASKILGKDSKTIVDDFDKVGIGINKISDNLSKSITYVQNMGVNARIVMADVSKNMDAISRFNFENGVQGITKMATQATMLRIDMSKTLDFADKVLDPEKAIETAAAFQRLGVSVGNLTDPFQLMNQSINDPSGLQTSITNALKSFTYFDAATKSFKVSPDGILKMKELESVVGMTSAEMRRTALATAEMDTKLQQIGRTKFGLQASEEDKMLVANMARMDKEGKFEVKIKDEGREDDYMKLSDLTQEQFDKLVQEQKRQPTDLKEIQLRQMNSAERLEKGVLSLVEFFKSQAIGLPGVQKQIVNSMEFLGSVGGSFTKALENIDFKKSVEQTKNAMEAISKDTTKTEIERNNLLFAEYKKFGEKLTSDVLPKTLRDAGKEITKSAQKAGGFTEQMLDVLQAFIPQLNIQKTSLARTGNLTSMIGGQTKSGIDFEGILGVNAANVNPNANLSLITALNTPKKQTVDVFFKNEMTTDVNVNNVGGLSQQELERAINEATLGVKQAIYNATKEVAVQKGEVKTQ